MLFAFCLKNGQLRWRGVGRSDIHFAHSESQVVPVSPVFVKGNLSTTALTPESLKAENNTCRKQLVEVWGLL